MTPTPEKGTPKESSEGAADVEADPPKPDPNLVSWVSRDRKPESDERADVPDTKDEETR